MTAVANSPERPSRTTPRSADYRLVIVGAVGLLVALFAAVPRRAAARLFVYWIAMLLVIVVLAAVIALPAFLLRGRRGDWRGFTVWLLLLPIPFEHCIVVGYRLFYIVRCADGSLDVGSTDNVEARITSHNEGRGGQHTRARRPVTLVLTEAHDTADDARGRERQLKRWTRAKKEARIRAELLLLRSLADSQSGPRKKAGRTDG